MENPTTILAVKNEFLKRDLKEMQVAYGCTLVGLLATIVSAAVSQKKADKKFAKEIDANHELREEISKLKEEMIRIKAQRV